MTDNNSPEKRRPTDRWKGLPTPVRAAIVAGAAIEVALLVAAQVDIARRPAEQIRGGKLRWRLVSLVNIAGPITYFRKGRLRPGQGRES